MCVVTLACSEVTLVLHIMYVCIYTIYDLMRSLPLQLSYESCRISDLFSACSFQSVLLITHHIKYMAFLLSLRNPTHLSNQLFVQLLLYQIPLRHAFTTLEYVDTSLLLHQQGGNVLFISWPYSLIPSLSICCAQLSRGLTVLPFPRPVLSSLRPINVAVFTVL